MTVTVNGRVYTKRGQRWTFEPLNNHGRKEIFRDSRLHHALESIATLTAENARLREDAERLDWMADNPPFDGMGDIDLHELWHEVATKNGREEASVEDQREAFRLLLDTARAQGRP